MVEDGNRNFNDDGDDDDDDDDVDDDVDDDDDDEDDDDDDDLTCSQLRSGLRWQSQAQGFPCNVKECNFATLSTVLCFSWK